MASIAICTSPSVPFLKPTGIDRPEASSRWIWLSVVRAPMAPQRDQVGDVLRRDRVEELGAGGHAHLGEVEQQVRARAQAVVDLEGAVEVRVVDQALPADGGARLLEVDAHHDGQRIGEFVRERLELPGVVACRNGIVDGAGPDDDKQARIASGEDISYLVARGHHGCRGTLRDGELFVEEHWRKDDLRPADPQIVCAMTGMHDENATRASHGRRLGGPAGMSRLYI